MQTAVTSDVGETCHRVIPGAEDIHYLCQETFEGVTRGV